MAGLAAAGAALAAVTAAGWAERTTVTASLTVLAHLHWLWIPAAVLLESASMAAFAIMLRRLLAAGGASVGIRPMLATAYAANAVSVSVPLAGPALATAFTFRRFTRQGADAPLAGWSLLAGGVTSSAAAALVVVAGGLASGNILVTAVTVPGGVLAIAAGVAAVVAVRRPRLCGALERPAGWMLRRGSRMLRRPVAEPGQTIQAWAQRLGSLRLSPAGWATATGLALANWLADAAVLAVSIHATGATVPWHDLLLVYGTGIAAQSLNITPGGLGVTEGSLGLALIATGLGASQALAAVLLYRLASFWLVALAGWLVVFWLRRPQARRGPAPSPNRGVPGARYRVGPGTGSRARRPQGHHRSLRNRPPAGTRPAGCSPGARRGRGPSSAQASPGGRGRCDRGVPGRGADHRHPDHSAGDDLNTSQILPVLVERGRRAVGPTMQPVEGKMHVANTRHDRAGGKSAGPRRGPRAKRGARERLAAERAARKRAEARRRLLAAIVAVAAVLAVVVTLVAVKLTSSPARLVARAIDGSAQVIVAAIDQVLHETGT